MNLSRSLRAHARARGAHSAIEHHGRVVSYAALDRAVDAAAALLAGKGVRAGDPVGVALSDRPEHLAFLYAIARLGGLFVPLDCRWTAAERERVCESFRVKLLVAEEGDPAGGVRALEVPAAWIEQAPATAPFPEAPGGGAPFAIYLSSGTTGLPKGPVLTHANMLARFAIYRSSLAVEAGGRFACVTPLYFSASRGFAMCILDGAGTLVLLPPPMPAPQLAAAIRDSGCTSTSLVPTLVRRLLEEACGDAPGCLFPDLRALISTGAPLNPHERAQAMARLSPDFYTFYGSSEGGGVSVLSPTDPMSRADSAGRILPGTEVRIVDERFRDLPEGATGRICYRSAATAQNFHGDSAPLHEGWFLPGDLGHIDAGYVYITGREKDMIIRGGVNIYPEEIERVLRGHPAVADAAVVGAPSAELGEEVVAYVALRSAVRHEDLATWCRRELAAYKVPRRFIEVGDLPKTPVGKPDKAALRQRVHGEASP
ncbi:MAG TPA: class I adenylate-forming enzyme family protein [Burkholderiales bacterium]|nr:class I adenylate-forming enzyme family protein [Burkholderiales bacterium]